MSDERDLEELVDRHLRGELSEPEREQLAQLLDSDPSARRSFVDQVEWDTRMAEALARPPEQDEPDSHPLASRTASRTEPRRSLTRTRAMLAIAAVVIVALTGSLYKQSANRDREIAKITGLSGSLLWTGDGGRIVSDLAVGAELRGGTIEGLAPDSWIDLEFTDGSTITLAGNSALTFSDHGQKELRVREGNVSANVKPQPVGRPMLISTRSALLEVLGTQFKINAEIASTTLDVEEGKVRVKRLSDGSTVDVVAQHRLVAAADHDMAPILVPESVHQWMSALHLGPRGTFGKWSPRSEPQVARLASIPYILGDGRTIYTTAIPVSIGDSVPVILQPNSVWKVRGQLASKPNHGVHFGVTLMHSSGEFAGRFQAIRNATEFDGGEPFELTLPLSEFSLDPSLKEIKDRLPESLVDLVVETAWCHTLYDPAGLEITELELISPTENKFQ